MNSKPKSRRADDMMPASLATCRANILQLQSEGAFTEPMLAGHLRAAVDAATHIAIDLDKLTRRLP